MDLSSSKSRILLSVLQAFKSLQKSCLFSKALLKLSLVGNSLPKKTPRKFEGFYHEDNTLSLFA